MKSILAVVFTLLSFFLLTSAVPAHGPSCEQCDPIPPNNRCDITTSCIRTEPNGQYHCACRAGYQADAPVTDSTTQWRTKFIGQEYRVFVKPGVVCNTLCADSAQGANSCQAITIRPECS
ncbi:unnamed protein product [Tuber melanosporum]|jgi:hypothetical protein|uniref:(Perigord truffle) hypothetical protein n=1 Tax=Tuber melanosporum (strain Mel28) TaxID=656061 RepID=D5GLX2_TUBMM|nr:uncharacterized protein GSTUM_00010457001 [Tuber melanosporum]CAZ85539.1 unnamed protein product [Tuber melanosporum]